MKRLCLILPLMAMLSGCGKPTPQQIASGISAALPILVEGGLVTAAKHSPTTVKSDASKIVTLIDTDVLPLIQNNTLSSAVFLPQLEAKLIQIVPTDYEMLVTGAFTASLMAGNIDLTLPAMTANEKSYVLAFVQGIRQGCVLYLAGVTKVSLYGPVDKLPVAEFSVPAEIVELNASTKNAQNSDLHQCAPAGNVVDRSASMSTSQAILDNSVVYCAPKPAGVPTWHANTPAIANAHQFGTPAGSKPSVAYREAREHENRDVVCIATKASGVSHQMAKSSRTVEPVARKQAVAEIQPSAIKTVDFNAGRVMLVFTSPGWCRYCKDMQPILTPIAASHSNVYVIDPDAGPLAKAQALQRDVYAIPMYIVYDNGVEQFRHTGVYSRDAVLGWLAQ